MSLYAGDTAVGVYVGEELISGGVGQLIELGTDDSYDIKTNYVTIGVPADTYAELTVDNFIIEATGNASDSIGCGVIPQAFLTVGVNFTVNKTYNPVTGILSASFVAQGTATMGSAYNKTVTVPHKVYLKL